MIDCVVCGRPTNTRHHLIFGQGRRMLCDNDSLMIPLCDNCHTLASYSLHDNPVSEHLSKMLGQSEWEKKYIIQHNVTIDIARESFVNRYGKSWL